MKSATQIEDAVRRGVAAALGAYLMWGFSPLFFRAIGHATALEVLAHRAVWSLLFTLFLVVLTQQLPSLKRIFSDFHLILILCISALLVALNWLVFIWAVNNGKALEASMGYFIMPITMVLMGRIFLTEHLSQAHLIALGLVCLGVLNLLLNLGDLPWVALLLSTAFALYGLVRKMAPVDSLTGLTFECLLLTPFALIYLFYLGENGELVFGTLGISFDLLLLSSALMTTLPLLLFTFSARRLRYATVGMLQYINPTCQFLLAVFLFEELFTLTHLVTFTLIWIGLGIYTYDSTRKVRV